MRQRIFGLALGYEDLIDHDVLRHDPALTAVLRMLTDFEYRTRMSWSTERRVIGKAKCTRSEATPRFIVTNIHTAFGAPRFLYETVYCQRGEFENR